MNAGVIIAAVRTVLTGWDVIVALLITLCVVVAARAASLPWLVEAAVLFGVALLAVALLFGT